MKLLILGGSGTISKSVAELAVRQGMEVTLLTRGLRPMIPGVSHITCDVRDQTAMEKALIGLCFNAVADFLTYLPDQANQNVALFKDRTAQYLFISSATVYEKPPRTLFMREQGAVRSNPYSSYAQNKIACEDVFTDAHDAFGFPITIVRPSYTYDEKTLPFVFNSRKSRYAVIARMKAGKPIVIPGDGSVFWTITHARDFAVAFTGLMAPDADAIGRAFHITTDERHTWDDFAGILACALNVKADLCHIATDTIIRFFPNEQDALLGDKAQTAVFDNSLIKQHVPGFECRIPFEQGIKECVQYFETHPEACTADSEWDAQIDRLIKAVRLINA